MEPTGTRHSRHDVSSAGVVRRGIARLAHNRVGKFSISALAIALALMCASVIGLGATFAGTDAPSMRAGIPVPGDQQQVINSAAQSCPMLAPARLAGQLMAESGFDQGATTQSGGHGVAGLTDAEWSRWLPAPGAARNDVSANIVALAHDMCDLIGQVRAAKVPGDGWRDALAAHHSGIGAVVKAGGVPSDATAYVDLVAAYAAWYAQPAATQPAATAAAVPAPSPTQGQSPGPAAGGWGPAKPIPAAYLPQVIAAGKTCPAITPARVAAQLMAASAFQPNLVGPTGAQGIAQFLPEVWLQYAPTPTASPWDPSTAIPALSSAMCDLFSQLSSLGADPYALALAAFQWGPLRVREAGGTTATATLQGFIQTVQDYAHAYATDPDLSDGKLAAPAPSPTPRVAASPTPSAAVPPSPSPSPVWTTLTVMATTALERGQSVHTNRTELFMDENGNLDIYDEHHQLRWTSDTSGRGGFRAVFQDDGNLVVYDANWQGLWASNTAGNDGAVLVLEQDGNVCVVNQGIVIWAANTAH